MISGLLTFLVRLSMRGGLLAARPDAFVKEIGRNFAQSVFLPKSKHKLYCANK
jgi:hypothetical protein